MTKFPCRVFIIGLMLSGCATLRTSSTPENFVAPEVLALNEGPSSQNEDELTKIWNENAHNSKGWWAGYKLAVRELEVNSEISCKIWSQLSNEKKFPLADLSLLRAYLSCQTNSHLNTIPTDLPSAYKALTLEAKTKILKQGQEHRVLVDVLRERAKLSEQKTEKIRFVQEAIDWAREIESTELIKELELQLFSYAPQLQENPADDQFVKVANEFRDERNFKQAEKYYHQVIQSKTATPDQVRDAYKGLRQTFRIKGDKTTALKITHKYFLWSRKQWMSAKKDSKKIAQLLDAGLMLARAQWTEGQSNAALKTLGDVAKYLDRSTSLGEVYLVQARIYEERGQLDKTLKWLDKALTQSLSPVNKDRVLWVKAWSLRKLGDLNLASENLKQLSETTQDVFDKNRFLFWQAKTLKELGKIRDAQNIFLQLQRDDSLGFYGLMSYHEMDMEFPPLEKNHLNTPGTWDARNITLSKEIRTNIDWLIVVGESKLAGKWIESLLGNSNPKNTNWGANEIYLFTKLAEAGQFLPLFMRLSYIPPDLKTKFINEKLSLIFPRPYYKEVKRASELSGTPIELIYAIMRQESAFDPETRSTADAFGLMQVLPELSETYSKQVGFRIQHHSELFKPEINIPLGSFVLKSLLEKYNNQYILTVSGYNANDKAVRTWLKTRFKGDPLEFIEEVPYDETRGYIKLTLRNYIYYSRIQRLGQKVPFPKATLMGLSDFARN